MKKIISSTLIFLLLLGLAVFWYMKRELHRKPLERYSTGVTNVNVKSSPHIFSREDADYFMLDSISFNPGGVTMAVRKDVAKTHEKRSSYFNNTFKEHSIQLGWDADVKSFRFNENIKFRENFFTKDLGFLYAYPAIEYESGIYTYRFVYLADIQVDHLDLVVLDGSVSEKSIAATWDRITTFRITKEQAERLFQ